MKVFHGKRTQHNLRSILDLAYFLSDATQVRCWLLPSVIAEIGYYAPTACVTWSHVCHATPGGY
jgi:hypothetical protein